ncbi:GATOR complex protein Iml1-like isoform X3 [Artemia franciscana]|uniref:DEP domain-containing protein 5 n=2 Tax=Artemia franciscana TaxID=6661 RepID=A0AA88LAW4_ARTSF|nr:hypothetical protein QYM36_008964 [Artemia franciscana]
MKLMKLFTHQMNISGGGGFTQDLVISSKDIPGLKVGDVVEIYHPEDEYSRLLIQVTSLKEELQHRDALSLDQAVASTFQLRALLQVYVKAINPSDISLDLVELTFKDQYVGRSEMWRLNQNLIGSAVYINKKIEFCQLVRCQVNEMWSKGERVAGGLITNDTRIVFRSASSMVYLFIQMSSEMWNFDVFGDLYFERAVDGFLGDLFTRWKKEGCNHEVTIVLFSRTYYEAASIDAFPSEMRSKVTADFRGRFYEDYYRVLVHNERSDDWHKMLTQLRIAFNSYPEEVLEASHKKYGQQNVPKAYNSSASHGNFLEVLNMSLNVFEKHYMDRSLDRTGQLSVVLTPGVGIFEVSRELTSITKQRIIDCGIGSDLVCVGEQPLHAVPLLRFQNKDMLDTDDYNIPHWLNLSFYTTNKKLGYSNFVPRLRLPVSPSTKDSIRLMKSQSERIHPGCETGSLNQLFDYDAYDAQVFTLPTHVQRQNFKPVTRKESRNTSVPPEVNPEQKKSIPTRPVGLVDYLSTSHAPTLFQPRKEFGKNYDSDDTPGSRTVIGSEGSPLERQLAYRPKSRPGRALINPFDPSRVPVKHTSGRRRWIHIYPRQPDGTTLDLGFKVALDSESYKKLADYRVQLRSTKVADEPFSPALTTGVDWKSLTTPACLPITTDYFPDSASLQKDYVVSDYTISPDDVNVDDYNRKGSRRPLETSQVYREFISQRLAQGFQLIVLPALSKSSARHISVREKSADSIKKVVNPSSSFIRSLSHVDPPTKESLLSIGRIFHKITLLGSAITVTGYKPRHPYDGRKFSYIYNLRTPYIKYYQCLRTDFYTEKLQHFNWNHMDHYICTGGSPDYALTESSKYWRLRMCFLPLDYSKRFRQDPPSPSANEDRTFDGFTKFLENTVNRMRHSSKKKIHSPLERTMSTIQKGEKTTRTRVHSVRGRVEKSSFRPEGRNSPSLDLESSTSSDSLYQEKPSSEPPKKITADSPLSEVADILKCSLPFLEKFEDLLPPTTFLSYEAIHYLVEDHGLSRACAGELLQKLLSEGYIIHASGSKTVLHFVPGFHLYCFSKISSPARGKEEAIGTGMAGDYPAFEEEFVEVNYDRYFENDLCQLINCFKADDEEILIDASKKYRNDLHKLSVFKEAYIDVDVTGRSDRKEWGHLLYPSYFTPNASFVAVLKWVEATGVVIFDLVLGWVRKAQINGFLLVPMPMDPLFIGNSGRCDPFRAPLTIPMNVKVIEECLEKFPASHWLHRLWLLHDAVARRFSYIPSIFENTRRFQVQYVHATGYSFLVMPIAPEKDSTVSISNRLSYFSKVGSSNADSNFGSSDYGLPLIEKNGLRMPCGFLWVANYLLTKKWKVSQTKESQIVDENAHSKCFQDLTRFCQDETFLRDFFRL